MDDDARPATSLPHFTPVPREKDRSNGWKPEVQRAFIEALAETGSVKAACRRVGRADHGAYMLRRHPDAGEFRRAWQAALDLGIQRIEDVAMDRAINGTEEPVYSYGKLVGTRIKYNDRLLMFMLRNRAPERFAGTGGARGLDAVDRMRMKRLKEAWRQEWYEEERAKQRDPKEVMQSIIGKLEAIESARRERQTPRERELEELLAEERMKREAREEEEAREHLRRLNPNSPRWKALDEEQARSEETGDTPPLLPGPDGAALGEEKQPEPLDQARAHILKMVEERAQKLRETDASPPPQNATEPEPPPAPPRPEPRIYSLK